MRKCILIIGLIGFSSICRAQGNGNGYLGKKNLVSFFGTSSVRLLTTFGEFGSQGSEVIEFDDKNRKDSRNKLLRYDLRASYARLLGSKIYLGAEVSYEKIFITKDRTYANNWSTPVLTAYGALLTVTFNSRDGIAPIGFASTLGIGPRFYTFDLDRNYRFNQQQEMKIAYPDYAKNMIGVNAFWQLSFRRILTRFLVLEFGMRLQTGYVFKNGKELENGNIYNDPQYFDPATSEIYDENYEDYDNTAIWSKESLIGSLRRENLLNVASFRIGLGFMF